MANPLVSVIIPVYKTEKYLRETARSVLGQSFSDWQMILVDDGSPDGAPKICDELAGEDPRITVIHKQNGGLSSARNAGIERAQGEFMFFLDSDDVLEPFALELAVGLMTDDTDAVISQRYIKFYDDGGQRSECIHIPEEELCADPREFALRVLMGRGRAWRAHSNLYRASIIKEHGVRFPVGHNAEDVVFNLRYYRHARRLAFITRPTLNYRKRGGSITATFDPDFMRTIDFIDSEAASFIEDCGLTDGAGFADSLYLRNTVVYATSMAARPGMKKQARALLSAPRMKQAAKGFVSYPYFEGRVKRAYMKTVFGLLKMGLEGAAFCVMLAASRSMK